MIKNSILVFLFVTGLALGQITKLPDSTLPAPTWNLPQTGDQTLIITRVVDGDTVVAAFLVPTTIRVWGINAPELITPEGKTAQEFAAKLIGTNAIIKAKLGGKEKYGRLLADITLADGTNLSDQMIKSNNAKPYNGHGPRP